MLKIRFVLLTVLFSFITIYYDAISVTAQNIVTTININPELNVPGTDIPVIPLAVGINNEDNRLYVYAVNRDNGKNEIVVINSLSNEIIDTISLPKEFNLFVQVEVNPATGRVYVASLRSNENNNKIHVIDGTTNKIIRTIEIDNGIGGIAINRVTNRIYVVNRNMVTVTVIDGQTNEIIDIIKLQDDTDFRFFSGGINVNPLTNRIYVVRNYIRDRSIPNFVITDDLSLRTLRNLKKFHDNAIASGGKAIIVIDGSTNEIIESVKLNFDDIVDVFDDIVDIIDLHITNTAFYYDFFADFPEDLIPNPVVFTTEIEINPVTNRIYINVNIENIYRGIFNAILVMDGRTNDIIDAIVVGKSHGNNDVIAVNPITNRIYIKDPGNNRVKVVDGITNQLISTIKTGVHPFTIKTDQSTNLLYITSIESGSVTVIKDDG